MSPVPAAPDPAHVSRVPRTLLDRAAQWWRTSTLTLWAVTGATGLFQLMVLNVASYTYPHLPLRGWVIVALLLTASLVARRHWPLAVVIVTSLASGAVDLWGPRGGLNLLSMLALYALLVAAPTRDRIIGFSISALCTLVPTALAKWPQVSALSPDFLALVLVLAMASISRSRREALEHGDAQLAAQSAKHRLVAQRDAARHQARVAAELHDSVGHDLTAIISLTEGLAGTVGDPDVDEAIGTINALAREGLADTRHAVDALSPLPSAAGDAVGPRGWDRLGEPLTTVRATGLSAALTETGRRPEDPRVGALVYTVVREALTNVMRHASGATRAVVALDHADGATRITVSDDGHAQGAPSAQEDGAPQPGPPEGPLAAPSSGHGLIHLAEALHEAGGTLSAGPVPGGWRLHAVVPHRAGA